MGGSRGKARGLDLTTPPASAVPADSGVVRCFRVDERHDLGGGIGAGEWQAPEARREAWAAAHRGTYRWLDYAALRAESVVWKLVDRFHLHGQRTRVREALR